MFEEPREPVEAAGAVEGPPPAPGSGPRAEPVDEAVRLHGPMVLGVCRRILCDAHDAEDAFQATFLLLARKGLPPRGSVAGWLHETALHVSLKLRRSQGRRRVHETKTAAMTPTQTLPEDPALDLRAVLDEELAALPDKYRMPLVLCYLEGKTNETAAVELGWTKGTVSGRMARARDGLRERLVRRGITVAGAFLLALRELPGWNDPVPPALERETLRRIAALRSAASPEPPGRAEAVADEVALDGRRRRAFRWTTGAASAAVVVVALAFAVWPRADRSAEFRVPGSKFRVSDNPQSAIRNPRWQQSAIRNPQSEILSPPSPPAWAEISLAGRRRTITLWRAEADGRKTAVGRVLADWALTLDPAWPSRSAAAYAVGDGGAGSYVFLVVFEAGWVPDPGGPPLSRVRPLGPGSRPRLSPDGSLLACLTIRPGGDGVTVLRDVTVRSVADGGESRANPDSLSAVGAPEWSPDGTSLVFSAVPASGGDGGVFLWNAQTRALTRCEETGPDGALANTEGGNFTRDGARAAVEDPARGLGAWNLGSGTVRWAPALGTPVRFVAWAPDRRMLIREREGAPRRAWLVDVETGRAEPFTRADYLDGPVSFSPDGHWLAGIRVGPLGRQNAAVVPLGGGEPIPLEGDAVRSGVLTVGFRDPGLTPGPRD